MRLAVPLDLLVRVPIFAECMIVADNACSLPSLIREVPDAYFQNIFLVKVSKKLFDAPECESRGGTATYAGDQ